MQIKKRAKAVKFGKKIDKPIDKSVDIEQEKKETLPPQIESKPEEQKVPIEEEPKITEVKEEPPIEPPQETSQEPVQEPTETQETILKVEASETYVVETKAKKNVLGYFMLISIISFVIGLLSMAGINLLSQKAQDSKNPQDGIKMSVTTTPTNSPSPTPEVLNLAEYNIKILNGSGITGAAAKLKASLVSEGFVVSSAGNAPESNHMDTTVFAKKDVNPKYLIKLKTFLEKSYTLAADSDILNVSTSEADIIITIGAR